MSSLSNNGTVEGSTGKPVDADIRKERHEKLRHLQKETFLLANYFFLFQGVIFTSFYSGSPRKCAYRWVPITLSSLAGGMNLWALGEFVFSYCAMLNDVDRIKAGSPNNGYAIGMILLKILRLIRAIVGLLCVVAFFVVMIIGCYKITCST